jgi:outer membrane lipoprotein SlyB
MILKQTIHLIPILLLAACAPPGQDRYDDRDVGRNATIRFGKVLSERPVEITGKNTGVGAAAGVGGGALAGSLLGRGTGSIGGMLAGAVVGGLAGVVAEKAISGREGIEYIVAEDGGDTVSVAQNVAEGDRPIRAGDRVMVQSGLSYQRVLPAPVPDAASHDQPNHPKE